jgi:hypothetical protein
MRIVKSVQRDLKPQGMPLAISIGLATLLLVSLLWGFQGARYVYADPDTLYVDGASGVDTTDCADSAIPCATIGYALDQATEGDTILVAGGIYTENLVITKTVALKGGYEAAGWSRSLVHNTTAIHGDGSSRVIHIQSTLSQTSVIDGFTITSGNGGISTLLSSVAILNSKVVHNHTTGAHSGGGMRIDHSSVTITNTLIADNISDHEDGALRIVSTVSIPGPASRVNIHNSTIANNRAQVRNGVFCSLSACNLVNSIVWGHAGEDLYNAAARYSDIEMSYPGEGNISTDPGFRDPTSGDYHLSTGSPCVDAGTNAIAPETDFEGDRRPADGDQDGTAIVDIGMDEFEPPRMMYLPLVIK